MLLFSGKVNGQSYDISGPELQVLGDAVKVLPEGDNSLSIEQVRNRTDFKDLSSFDGDLQGLHNYWLKVTLHNRLNDARFMEWVLRLSLSITDAEAYIPSAGGEIHVHRTGFFLPVDQRTFAPTLKANLLKFHLPPGSDRTIYIRARSDRASITPNLELQLESAPAFFLALQKKKQGSALFIGFCLMMLIYTLILWVYSRDLTYAYYAVYLISISLFVAYVNGDAHDILIPALMPEEPRYIYLVKLINYGGLVGYMSFIRAFLDLRQLLPFWDKFFKYLSWAAMPVLLLDLFLMLNYNFSYTISDRVTIPYSLFFVLSSLVFVLKLLIIWDKKGLFVVAGLTFMGLGVLFTALDRLSTVAYSIKSFEIGGTFELIVFSIGLAYRQQVIRREKQLAQFELEKSQLIQKQEHAEMERQKELHQLKTELYTNITHELRTPLTVIMGMIEQIEGHPFEKGLINRNTQSLLRLVNQVMDLAKLEAGRMELQMHQTDIIPFLRYLCESFNSGAEAKQILLTFESSRQNLEMDFDEEKIQQIVYNLLSNALKYTSGKGTIKFEASTEQQEDQEFLVFRVEDTGRGIAEEELPHIFDRFYQSRLHRSEQYGGSGIGLALTKQLILLMQGAVAAESTLNQGTTFVVRLPIHRKAEKVIGTKTYEPATELETVVDKPGQAAAKNPDQPHILVIEDNKDVIAYIQSCLEGHYQISKAHTGKSGLALALEKIPDIILSDVMMPEMNGYDLCKTLKNDLRTSHVPIILLTARAEEQDKIKGLRHGADAYLTKPFNKEELLIRIERLIELREKLQQRFLRSYLVNSSIDNIEENTEAVFLQNLRKKVFEQIDNSEFSVPDLGDAAHLGPTQLYRKLKALTGLTPIQFIRNIRMEHAAKLLIQHHSVSEAAYAVGFTDPNYFSRIFQQTYGHPPSEHK